ncbi:MAG: helix-hairpin-helix domain-containing protein [Clostridiales bacterium]|nr:helix-hairpin-helix domain-containing protein [Clostridiales bacterium]
MKELIRNVIFLMIIMGVLMSGLLSGCGKEQTVIWDTAQETQSQNTPDALDRPGTDDTPAQQMEEQDAPLVAGKVYIWGEIKNPGVYEFYPDARIGDIVELAGGLTKKAAPGCVNLAALVEDGQEIHIYDKSSWDEQGRSGQPLGQSTGQSGSENSQTLVNLNTATKEQLMTLPGIGEAKAQAILNFRSEQGAFLQIEDIMKITGIKEKMFQKIKNYITV